LLDSHPQAPGQVEHLDVEGEGADAGALEDGPPGLSAEALEAALRVPDDGEDEEAPGGLDESPSEHPAQAALGGGVGAQAALPGDHVVASGEAIQGGDEVLG